MARASKASATDHVELEGFEGHYAELGGTTVGWETYTVDADLTPLFKGLPDDRCQCEHWGYVVKGKITYVYADGEETYEAGDAYYAPPGHTTILFAGAEIVEFSPTDSLEQTMEVVTKNMEAAAS